MERSKNSIFLSVNVAALRARQIMQGATPLVECNSRKPAAVAIKEVEQEKVQFFLPEEPEAVIEESPFTEEQQDPVEELHPEENGEEEEMKEQESEKSEEPAKEEEST